MRFAINLPNFGEYGDPSLLVDLARETEDAGWDGLFIRDHVQAFVPGERVSMVDPWVALAAIAVATSRIRLEPMVTPVSRRCPWKLARESVTVDHLSGVRLILGVGLGESAHGVAEELTLKHRTLRLLVEQSGFRPITSRLVSARPHPR